MLYAYQKNSLFFASHHLSSPLREIVSFAERYYTSFHRSFALPQEKVFGLTHLQRYKAEAVQFFGL